jgi:hypothetical protein
VPSVCIHVRKTYSEPEEIAIMNAVHAALVTAFGVGADDKNITLIVHRPHRFMCPPDRDDPDRYTNITVVGQRESNDRREAPLLHSHRRQPLGAWNSAKLQPDSTARTAA